MVSVNDIHIHGCIDETSLSYLNSPYFIGCLFGLDFGGGSSLTSWMKENMADYFDAYYIILEYYYRTWDPCLCHLRRYDIILDACVCGPHDDLLT